MGFKLTKENLDKIILQEIRKLTEFNGLGGEKEEEEYDEPGGEYARRPGYLESDPERVREEDPEELTGELGFGPEESRRLMDWAEQMGFDPTREYGEPER
jgi:hypothetical protein